MLLGVCANPLCIVTEFCSKGSLYNLLRSTRPEVQEILADPRQITKIIMGIARGMLHLVRAINAHSKIHQVLEQLQHSENVVHRDLAARNVLLTSSYEAKVRWVGAQG